jgi:hypothetical protein
MANTKKKKNYKFQFDLRIHASRLAIVMYSIIGIYGAWRIGTYADAPADALLAKYNFGELFKIDEFTKDYPETWITYVSSYGYSVAIFIFGPIWLIGKLIDPGIGLQNEIPMFFRNLMSYSVGMLGIFALYKWGKVVLSPRLQFLPLFFPLFAPVLFGNFFMNSKDVPLFTGFSALVYLFALLLDSKEEAPPKKSELVFWTFISIVFTVGVRPISLGWVGPLLLILFILCKSRKNKCLTTLAVGVCISSLYVTFTNYYLLTNPLYWFSNLLDTGKNFPWTGAVLSWGKLYRAPEIPRRYLSEMLLSQIPLIVVFTFLLFVLTFKLQGIKFIQSSPVSVRISLIMFSFIIFQSILLEPVIYDNGRQLLFVWLFILVISIWFIQVSYPKLLKSRFLTTFLVLLGVISFIDQVRVFPYNYIYRNEIARTLPQGSFETDYWGISGKELTNWVINDSEKDDNRKATFGYIFQQSYEPYVKGSLLVPVSINDLTAKYYSQIWRPGLLPDFSAQCPIVFSVERSFFMGKKEVLGYVRKC